MGRSILGMLLATILAISRVSINPTPSDCQSLHTGCATGSPTRLGLADDSREIGRSIGALIVYYMEETVAYSDTVTILTIITNMGVFCIRSVKLCCA